MSAETCVGVHTFDLSTWEQADLYEFKASLVYIESSRTASASETLILEISYRRKLSFLLAKEPTSF